MTSYLEFSVAQPIIVLSWYGSSFLLIAPVIAASFHLRVPRSDQVFTQTFYYTTFAAGLYFIISTLMFVSVCRAYSEHYSREFKRTIGQLSLMRRALWFKFYLLGGAAIFKRIKDWTLLDTLYWADYTILTIGIGDFAPKTHLGRSLLFPFTVRGVIILGLHTSIKSFFSDRERKKLRVIIAKKHLDFLKHEASKKNNPPFSTLPKGKNRESIENRKHPLSKDEFHIMRSIQIKVAQRHR